jgi:hypothetical protein
MDGGDFWIFLGWGIDSVFLKFSTLYGFLSRLLIRNGIKVISY